MTAPQDELRVTTLELFFDLVFVFTITQLTAVLSHRPDLVGLAQMALLLGVIWWMYGGYAWLTNVVPPTGSMTRALLVFAMVAYLVLAISVPKAFTEDGWVFAAAYLVIVLLHSGLFVTTRHAGNRRAILRVLPWNLGASLLLFVAAATEGPVHWACWVLVPVILWGGALVVQPGEFSLRPAHFVERHGLVLIIAFGESVVAVGIAAADLPVSFGLVASAALTLIVLSGLWWCYFAGDNDVRAERSLAAAPPSRQTYLSVLSFGHCYLVVLGGVIVFATGVKKAVGHPWEALPLGAALAIGGGAALYLLGDVLLRRVLRLGPNLTRMAAALLAALSTAVGVRLSAIAELTALACVVALLVAAEHFPLRPPVGAPASTTN